MEKKDKSSKRKGCCLWFLLVGLGLIALVIAIPVFRICPPKGPWPTPPWCYAKEDCTTYEGSPFDGLIRKTLDGMGATGLQVANACMFMRSFGDNTFIPYQYKELDYITGTENYPPVDREMNFGIEMFDYWGHNYEVSGIDKLTSSIPSFIRNIWNKYFSQGTDTRRHNNLENSVERVKQLGGDYFYVIDFIALVDDDLNLERSPYAGLNSMSQEDMDHIAEVTHDGGLESIISLTMIDTDFFDQFSDYFNENDYGSLYDVMDGITKFDRFNVGDATERLHEVWRTAILNEAAMAEKAGIDRLIVNFLWLNQDPDMIQLDDAEWKETIAEIREVYSGKLGAFWVVNEGIENYSYFNDVDFVYVGVENQKYTAGIAEDDMDGLVNAWKEYLNSPQFDAIRNVPEVMFRIYLMSYDGAIDNGWFEIGGKYPDKVSDYREQAVLMESFMRALYETPDSPINALTTIYDWHDYIYPNLHEIRNDLGTSVRGKDAENVFHRWMDIFQ